MSVALRSKADIYLGDKTGLRCPVQFGEGHHIGLSNRTVFGIRRSTTRPFVIRAFTYSIRILKAGFGMATGRRTRSFAATLLGNGMGVAGGLTDNSRVVLSPGRGMYLGKGHLMLAGVGGASSCL